MSVQKYSQQRKRIAAGSVKIKPGRREHLLQLILNEQLRQLKAEKVMPKKKLKSLNLTDGSKYIAVTLATGLG